MKLFAIAPFLKVDCFWNPLPKVSLGVKLSLKQQKKPCKMLSFHIESSAASGQRVVSTNCVTKWLFHSLFTWAISTTSCGLCKWHYETSLFIKLRKFPSSTITRQVYFFCTLFYSLQSASVVFLLHLFLSGSIISIIIIFALPKKI